MVAGDPSSLGAAVASVVLRLWAPVVMGEMTVESEVP